MSGISGKAVFQLGMPELERPVSISTINSKGLLIQAFPMLHRLLFFRLNFLSTGLRLTFASGIANLADLLLYMPLVDNAFIVVPFSPVHHTERKYEDRNHNLFQ
jgi:hypothetical protein